jgi:hypothetical protein
MMPSTAKFFNAEKDNEAPFFGGPECLSRFDFETVKSTEVPAPAGRPLFALGNEERFLKSIVPTRMFFDFFSHFVRLSY